MKVKKTVIPARKLEGSRFDIGDKLGSFKASTEIALMPSGIIFTSSIWLPPTWRPLTGYMKTD